MPPELMKNQTKLKKKDFAVIFDMDGVIFDTQKLIFASEKILFKKLNLNIADTEHHTYAGKTSWELWRTLKQKYDLPQTLEELVGTHRKFGFEYIKNKKPAPIKGVVELLNSLKENDIKKLQELDRNDKLNFKTVKISKSLPFAPFMFFGLLITYISHGNALIYLITMKDYFLMYIQIFAYKIHGILQ